MKSFQLQWVLLLAAMLSMSSVFLPSSHASALKYPNILGKPLPEHSEGMRLSAHPRGVHASDFWYVYVSQNGVEGSLAQGSGTREFSFMDVLLVVEERSNSIKAVLVDDFDQYDGSLVEGHQAYWFDKKDLLLWRNCLINPNVVVDKYEAEFNRRAMVINRLQIDDVDEEAQIGFFNVPNSSDSQNLQDNVTSFTILFVYKESEDGQYLLLGTESSIDHRNPLANLRGWVNRDFISEWNHHLALELNWDAHDREHYAKIFTDRENAERFISDPGHVPPPAEGSVVFNENYLGQIYKERASGFENRFFDLTESVQLGQRTPKVGAVGSIYLDDEMDWLGYCLPDSVPPDRISGIREKLADGIGNSRQINLVFVVDASQSMAIYGHALREALKDTMDEFERLKEEEGIRMDFRLGAIVFRDESELPPNQYAYSASSLTSNVSLMDDFFEAQMTEDLNTPNNNTHPEGLYHAMYNGISNFEDDIDPLNTNYMILIGDAGDNPNSWMDITQQKVIDKLDQYNFNLLGYQLRWMPHASIAYDDYREDVPYIMTQLALNKNAWIRESYDDYSMDCPGIEGSIIGNLAENLPQEWNDVQHWDVFEREGFDGINAKRTRSSSFPIIAQFTYPEIPLDDAGNPMDTNQERLRWSDLQQLLIEDLRSIPINVDSLIIDLSELGREAEELRLIRIIYQGLLYGLTIEETVLLLSQFTEVYEEGYTVYEPTWMSSTEEPLYRYVAMMGYFQTRDIHRHFGDLVPSYIIGENRLRNNLYNILEEILVRKLRLVRSEDFSELTVAQSLTYMTGLPAPDIYERYHSRDIIIADRFSSEMLYRLCMDLIISMGHLQSIITESNAFDDQFFTSYSRYLERFLENAVRDEDVDELDVSDLSEKVANRLVSHYAAWGDYYSDYPQMTTNLRDPFNRRFWNYWVDARLLPSQVYNPSERVKEALQDVLE